MIAYPKNNEKLYTVDDICKQLEIPRMKTR